MNKPPKTEFLPPIKSIKRLIGTFNGQHPGPNVIFFAGVHGNEPAGIYALRHVFNQLKKIEPRFKGNMYGIAGNLKALESGIRFIQRDLNRIWFPHSLISPTERKKVSEYSEKIDILKLLIKILQNGKPTYIFDLHTTSAHSMPFISISDTLKNRKIIRNIPAHLVLGLEELLDGPMFSFFSELGLPAVLFEAGQHNAISSYENHVAFIWMMLDQLRCIKKPQIPNLKSFADVLRKNTPGGPKIYAIKHRQAVNPEEDFSMKDGFVNFQSVAKGEILARNKQGPIVSRLSGNIFMPLYQDQGCDGFFLVREIRDFWFQLSSRTRKWNLDKTITLLPGIYKARFADDAYMIDKNKNWKKTISLLHLLGYRKVHYSGKILRMSRRPYDRRSPKIDIVRENFTSYLNMLTD